MALALVIGLGWSFEAAAGKASVVGAKATSGGGGTYSFSASVDHADTGWDHYANKFEILTPDGKVLGTRVLFHPHVGERPFTRSLGGVKIPSGMTSVIVRAWDSVHKAGDKTFTVKLPGR
ncbi:MAG: hypothetical protein HN377_03715 [Alphaproteobacteria bacterium]|nr:hypothetical protein [Alphaproteobacteria bacterium]